jgi:hypothetical protein
LKSGSAWDGHAPIRVLGGALNADVVSRSILFGFPRDTGPSHRGYKLPILKNRSALRAEGAMLMEGASFVGRQVAQKVGFGGLVRLAGALLGIGHRSRFSGPSIPARSCGACLQRRIRHNPSALGFRVFVRIFLLLGLAECEKHQ